jgi:hypothetical protein
MFSNGKLGYKNSKLVQRLSFQTKKTASDTISDSETPQDPSI